MSNVDDALFEPFVEPPKPNQPPKKRYVTAEYLDAMQVDDEFVIVHNNNGYCCEYTLRLIKYTGEPL
jgi:hypothetical protein